MEHTQKWPYAWIFLILLALIWGSSFILMKKALIVFSPIQLAALRISLSSILFFPFFLIHVKKVNWKLLPYLVIVALCGSTLPAFLFAYAQTEISSSLAGIINSLAPLFTFVFGLIIFRRGFSWMALGGVIVGLLGALLLILMSGSSNLEGNITYSLLALFASMCYGISVNTVQAKLSSMKPFTINTATFSMVGPITLVILFSTDFLAQMETGEAAWEALGYVAILSWLGTFAATVIFFLLVQKTSALVGSSVAYLIPIVALLWGWVDGEALLWFHFVGLLLIILGVYTIRQGR